MSNVIQFPKKRSSKYKSYHELNQLSKGELLEHMVGFQEERKVFNHTMSKEMMEYGVDLFSLLEQCADSQELKILSRSYTRHLQNEIVLLGRK